MEKPEDCLATHLQNVSLSDSLCFQEDTITETFCTAVSSFKPCQVPLSPSQQGGFHYWVLHCGFPPSHYMWSNILIFEIVYFLSLKAKISCKIQTRLTARLIKFRTFRPSCKIKSMPVAAFHNMFTSQLCDAIKMLHLQVILLAFAFMLWLKGLALKST